MEKLNFFLDHGIPQFAPMMNILSSEKLSCGSGLFEKFKGFGMIAKSLLHKQNQLNNRAKFAIASEGNGEVL
jgi:hypothetical protein